MIVAKGVANPACLATGPGPDSSTVPGVTEPDAAGPSPAAIDLHEAHPHARQVVRRVLLRRNIAIDAETAQLVAAAFPAAAPAPTRSRRRL